MLITHKQPYLTLGFPQLALQSSEDSLNLPQSLLFR